MNEPGRLEHEMENLFKHFDVGLRIETDYDQTDMNYRVHIQRRDLDDTEIVSTVWYANLADAICDARKNLEDHVVRFSGLQREPF